jgi:hypothetical protein
VIGTNEREIFAKGFNLGKDFRLADVSLREKSIGDPTFWAIDFLKANVSSD